MDWAELGWMIGAGLATTVGGLALLAPHGPEERSPGVRVVAAAASDVDRAPGRHGGRRAHRVAPTRALGAATG